MEIQVEIRKLHDLIQKLLFKENPLLMLTNQYKALFIILINQNKDCPSKQSKAQKTPAETCFRDSCKVHYLH